MYRNLSSLLLESIQDAVNEQNSDQIFNKNGTQQSAYIHHISYSHFADRMYATDVKRQTDVRQHHCLMPPQQGHNNSSPNKYNDEKHPKNKPRISQSQQCTISTYTEAVHHQVFQPCSWQIKAPDCTLAGQLPRTLSAF